MRRRNLFSALFAAVGASALGARRGRDLGTGDRNQGEAANDDRNDLTTATLAAVERFNEAFNRHDVHAVMAAMSDDCVVEDTAPPPDGARHAGQAAVHAYWERFVANSPHARFEAEDSFAAADRAVVRWTYRKTRNGQPWHLRGVDVFRVRGGRIVEKLAYVKG